MYNVANVSYRINKAIVVIVVIVVIVIIINTYICICICTCIFYINWFKTNRT